LGLQSPPTDQAGIGLKTTPVRTGDARRAAKPRAAGSWILSPWKGGFVESESRLFSPTRAGAEVGADPRICAV